MCNTHYAVQQSQHPSVEISIFKFKKKNDCNPTKSRKQKTIMKKLNEIGSINLTRIRVFTQKLTKDPEVLTLFI